ncbi:MAG: F0F1 ATP synthase subunit A [Candidatus Marinimicrobia bacterium]|nr:F0F1 ATP synthase subunit A [Candidatus Neomarinimicrobiota bacterium]
MNKNVLLFLSFLLTISFAEYGSGYNQDAHKKHHDTHGEEHHDAGVTGEVIVHHIQDGSTFEIFNPLHPTHPFELKLTTTWNDIHPALGNWFGWMLSGKGYAKEPDQLIFTKQSIMMFLAAILIILFFVVGYKKDRKVQSGFGNLLEVFVVFIRDEVVYPNMGKKQGRRFLPLILTFFFFIVLLNLLGLIPGSSTATASFSVTVGLALITFFTYIFFGNKDFWRHIFATPGVPLWLLPIMIPVELIGLLTKPFALSVRLLANMNAGHIIILAFLGIIINVKSYYVALGSVPMALAINMLEIFVALLQGYIFALLSSIFIGMAVVEHEHH